MAIGQFMPMRVGGGGGGNVSISFLGGYSNVVNNNVHALTGVVVPRAGVVAVMALTLSPSFDRNISTINIDGDAGTLKSSISNARVVVAIGSKEISSAKSINITATYTGAVPVKNLGVYLIENYTSPEPYVVKYFVAPNNQLASSLAVNTLGGGVAIFGSANISAKNPHSWEGADEVAYDNQLSYVASFAEVPSDILEHPLHIATAKTTRDGTATLRTTLIGASWR